MKSFFKHIIVAVLTAEAKMLLLRTQPKIIAITGSVGKTSTKDAIYKAIAKKVYARKSEKSYNSELGVPLTVLGLPNAWSNPVGWLKNIFDGAVHVLFPGSYPEWLVLEIGVDRPGDMSAITKWIQPDITVLTRLPDTPVHVEFFDSPEAVAAEKERLVKALKPDGVLVYNNDDETVTRIAEETRQQVIGFGRYSKASFLVSADRILYKEGKAFGFEFKLSHANESVVMSIIGSLGVQHAYNYAAAAAVASVLEIPLEDVAEALKGHVPPPGRMRILEGIKDALIIDDSYNSSPEALMKSLQTLKEVTGVKRRIAVLGDMLELGQYSVQEHEEAGKQVAKCADILFAIGVRARSIAEGALESGMSEKNIFQYEDSRKAGKELQNMLTEGDVVLVKGSQSIRAERVVEEVMAHPEDAERLLVRQDAVWKTK